MARELAYEIGQASDKGKQRDHNEDSLDLYEPKDPDQLESRGRLFVVADGMGGHEAGAVASDRACRKITEQYYYSDLSLSVPASLKKAFETANTEVFRLSQTKGRWRGMGTTAVAAVLKGDDELCVAHVGDSRAYLVRGEEIRQITRDHSWVQQRIDDGLSPDAAQAEARKRRRMGAITRSLGRRPRVDVDVLRGEGIQPGDILVLCSDGLSDLVSDREIWRVVTRCRSQRAAEQLIGLANHRGGRDNITVLIVKVIDPEQEEEAQTQERTPPFPVPVALILAVLGATVAMGFAFSRGWLPISVPTPSVSAPPTVSLSAVSPGEQVHVEILPPQSSPPATTGRNGPSGPAPTYTPAPIPAGYQEPAVALLEPSDGAVMTQGEKGVVLRWTGEGTLLSDQYYVVHLHWSFQGQRRCWSFGTKETKVLLSGRLFAEPHLYGTPCTEDHSSQGSHLAAPVPRYSDKVVFEWAVSVSRLVRGNPEDGQWAELNRTETQDFTWASMPTPTPQKPPHG